MNPDNSLSKVFGVEPLKQGDEFKNPAKYQQRMAELRMGLLRAEADIAGLRRELARLGTVVAKP